MQHDARAPSDGKHSTHQRENQTQKPRHRRLFSLTYHPLTLYPPIQPPSSSRLSSLVASSLEIVTCVQSSLAAIASRISSDFHRDIGSHKQPTDRGGFSLAHTRAAQPRPTLIFPSPTLRRALSPRPNGQILHDRHARLISHRRRIRSRCRRIR